MATVKGIIFDYGGTLDSRGDHWSEVLWRGYVEAGAEVDKAAFRDAYVYAERELARTRHILPQHDFRDVLLIKVGIELEYLANAGNLRRCSDSTALVQKIAGYGYDAARCCIEEARGVLETLYARYPLVLVSNFYGNIESVLADFGISRYFKTVIESAVVGVRKPDPRIFQLGVEALGLSPEEVLVVGDSYKKDILPAESIGCRVAWLKGKGWSDDEDAIVHPAVIADLSDVVTLLQQP